MKCHDSLLRNLAILGLAGWFAWEVFRSVTGEGDVAKLLGAALLLIGVLLASGGASRG